MRKALLISGILTFISCHFAFSQYGGYGGGYGGGGYGRGGGFGRQNGGFGSNTPYKPTAKDVAKQETKWMKKNLNLTDDQEKIMEEINLDYDEQKENLFNAEMKGEPTQEKMLLLRPKYEELDRRKEEEYKRLLKPEQWDTYVQKKKEAQEKREKESKSQRRF